MTNDNTQPDRILVAQIGPPHGVRGAVKLRLYLDDPTVLDHHPTLYVGAKSTQTITLKLGAETTKGWIATLDAVTDRTAAEKWRGTDLYLDRDALPDLAEDDGYYITDLVGCTVMSAAGVTLGSITAVDNFGASDLLDIRPPIGPDYYLPFTDDTIVAVDLSAKTITISNYESFASLHLNQESDEG